MRPLMQSAAKGCFEPTADVSNSCCERSQREKCRDHAVFLVALQRETQTFEHAAVGIRMQMCAVGPGSSLEVFYRTRGNTPFSTAEWGFCDVPKPIEVARHLTISNALQKGIPRLASRLFMGAQVLHGVNCRQDSRMAAKTVVSRAMLAVHLYQHLSSLQGIQANILCLPLRCFPKHRGQRAAAQATKRSVKS